MRVMLEYAVFVVRRMMCSEIVQSGTIHDIYDVIPITQDKIQ